MGVGQLGVVGGLPRDPRERLVELPRRLPVRPPDHGVDSGIAAGGGVQERGEALLGRDRPEVAALDAAAVELARRGQAPRHLQRSVP